MPVAAGMRSFAALRMTAGVGWQGCVDPANSSLEEPRHAVRFVRRRADKARRGSGGQPGLRELHRLRGRGRSAGLQAALHGRAPFHRPGPGLVLDDGAGRPRRLALTPLFVAAPLSPARAPASPSWTGLPPPPPPPRHIRLGTAVVVVPWH